MRYNLEELIREDRPQWRPQPSALVVQPLRRGYRAGCEPSTLGAFSLDSVARGMGTDTKTLLLVGGAGLLAGWLLNNVVTGVRRKVRRGVSKAKRAAKQGREKLSAPIFGERTLPLSGITPMNLIVVALVGGGAWWMYHRHQQAQVYRASFPTGGRG